MARLIAVAGAPGTGTTTLCKLLSDRTGMVHVYAGQVFRQLAAEHHMEVTAFNRHAEQHPEIDIELDQRMIEVAKKGGCILEGRMVAWQLQKAHVHDALRVLLEAPEEVRAARVAKREGVPDFHKVLMDNRHREASEAKRFREFYGFDPNDPRHYDLVVDSSGSTPEEIADLVMAKFTA